MTDRCFLLLWQMDEDADDLSFPAMVSQLLEFVLCIVGNEKLLPLLQPVLPELTYLTIGGLRDMASALHTVRCRAAYVTAPHARISASGECTFTLLANANRRHIVSSMGSLFVSGQLVLGRLTYSRTKGRVLCGVHSDHSISEGPVVQGVKALMADEEDDLGAWIDLHRCNLCN